MNNVEQLVLRDPETYTHRKILRQVLRVEKRVFKGTWDTVLQNTSHVYRVLHQAGRAL
jgi:hypothetical protein